MVMRLVWRVSAWPLALGFGRVFSSLCWFLCLWLWVLCLWLCCVFFFIFGCWVLFFFVFLFRVWVWALWFRVFVFLFFLFEAAHGVWLRQQQALGYRGRSQLLQRVQLYGLRPTVSHLLLQGWLGIHGDEAEGSVGLNLRGSVQGGYLQHSRHVSRFASKSLPGTL